jgi:Flp pilus assembly secretin CpaC
MRALTWTKMAARVAFVSAPLALALFASAPAQADGVQGAHAPIHVTRETTREIRVALDQAVAVRLAGAANGISIGNPSIAGVSVQNDHLLFVTGRSYGSTNLIVLGPDDHVLYSGRVTVVADENGTVVLTRGASTERLECAPTCRARPDIGDAREAYEGTAAQISNHASTAGGQGH